MNDQSQDIKDRNKAILQQPLEEVLPPAKRKPQEGTIAATLSFPYDVNIQTFLTLDFREPIVLRAGETAQLVIIPRRRRV